MKALKLTATHSQKVYLEGELIMAFQTINPNIGEMKTRLRAMQHKRDNLAIEVAKILNLPNVWSLDMVDWNNPLVSNYKDEIFTLEENIKDLRWKIRCEEEPYDLLIAEKKVYAFLGNVPSEKALAYLKEMGLTTHGLIWKVRENPNFIVETYGEVGV